MRATEITTQMKRRTLLTAAGTSLTAVLAGCSDGNDQAAPTTTQVTATATSAGEPTSAGTATDGGAETDTPTETPTLAEIAVRNLEDSFAAHNDFAVVKEGQMTTAAKIARLYPVNRVDATLRDANTAIQRLKKQDANLPISMKVLAAAHDLSTQLHAQAVGLRDGYANYAQWQTTFADGRYRQAQSKISAARNGIQRAVETIPPSYEVMNNYERRLLGEFENVQLERYLNRNVVLNHGLAFVEDIYAAADPYTTAWIKLTAGRQALTNSSYQTAETRLSAAVQAYQTANNRLTDELVAKTPFYTDRVQTLDCLLPKYVDATKTYLNAALAYQDGNTKRGNSLLNDAEATLVAANTTCRETATVTETPT